MESTAWASTLTTELYIEGRLIQGVGVSLAKDLERLSLLGRPCMNYSTIINVSFYDDEHSRINNRELARVFFEVGVADGEDGGSMVVVEDIIGNSCAIDAALDLYISVTVGFRQIGRKTSIVGEG